MSKLRIIVELSKALVTVRTPQEIKAIKAAMTYLQSKAADHDLGKIPTHPPDWFITRMMQFYSKHTEINTENIWEEIVGRLSKPAEPVEPKWYEKLEFNQRFIHNIYPNQEYHFKDLRLCIVTVHNTFLRVDQCSPYTPPTTEEIIKELKASLTVEQRKLVEQIPYQFVKLK